MPSLTSLAASGLTIIPLFKVYQMDWRLISPPFRNGIGKKVIEDVSIHN